MGSNGYFEADGHILEPEGETAEFLEEPYSSHGRDRVLFAPLVP